MGGGGDCINISHKTWKHREDFRSALRKWLFNDFNRLRQKPTTGFCNTEMGSIRSINFLSRLFNADSVPKTANRWYEMWENGTGSWAGRQKPKQKSENLLIHTHAPSRNGAHHPCLRAVTFHGPTHTRSLLSVNTSSLPNFTHSCRSGIQTFSKSCTMSKLF